MRVGRTSAMTCLPRAGGTEPRFMPLSWRGVPMPKRRVLIVEDDVAIAVDLVDAESLVSRSVARAKVLLERAIDLALLDVDVTNGKTFEVAMLLKLRQVPFVF